MANRKRSRIVKKHIPDFIFAVSQDLLNKGTPEDYASPKYLHDIFRQCCKAMGDELVANVDKGEDNWVEAFGWGKFWLTEGSGYKKRKKGQYYLRFKQSTPALARMREKLGTATEAEIRNLRASELFLKALSEKRHNFLDARDKRREEAIEARKMPDEARAYAELIDLDLS
jgi:hypothetical protein